MIYWVIAGVFLSVGLVVWVMADGLLASSGRLQRGAARRVESLVLGEQEATIALSRLLKDKSDASQPWLNRLLKKVAVTRLLARWLVQAGSPFNVGSLLTMTAVLGGCGFAGGMLRGSWVLAAVAGTLAAMLPWMWVRRRRKKRLNAFAQQFPEAVDLISRSLRAGHSFSTALQTASQELKEPLTGELSQTFEDYSAGKSIEDALDDLTYRVGLRDVGFFATAVRLQKEIGGNLTEVLDNIAMIIRERFKMQRHIKALSAQGRLSGWVLSLLAPLLSVALFVTNPKYIMTMINDPTGRQVLYYGLGLQVLGMLVIKRLVNIKV